MALTPAQIRRRKMNMLMAMSYAAFNGSRTTSTASVPTLALSERDADYILDRAGDYIQTRV